MIDRLADIVGHPLERNHVDTRPGDVPHSQADNTLLRSLFPDVAPVPLDDGLRATVAWMRDYLAVPSRNVSETGLLPCARTWSGALGPIGYLCGGFTVRTRMRLPTSWAKALSYGLHLTSREPWRQSSRG